MTGLEFSENARIVLPEFDIDAKKIRIYVEGKDDIPFWANVFESVIPKGYELLFEEQGGSKNIYKLLDKVKGMQTFIAALDSEYDSIINDKIEYSNKLTIFTKRHSIENYLFCANSLQRIINVLNRENINDTQEIEFYINKLCSLLEILLYLDCKKYITPTDVPKELSILGGGSNIAKFSNDDIYPSSQKISKFIQDNYLEHIEYEHVKQLFNGQNLFYYINGHFITYSIAKFVSSKLKNKNISHNSLYDHAYASCSSCTSKCSDYNKLKQDASKIVENYLKSI